MTATCFCCFLCYFSFFAIHQDNPGLGINQCCQVFLHCPPSDGTGKQEATIINGILSLLLPRSRHQIWGSGLSSEELRAADIQATGRRNMSLVSAMQALGPHRLAVPSHRSQTGFSIGFHPLCRRKCESAAAVLQLQWPVLIAPGKCMHYPVLTMLH